MRLRKVWTGALLLAVAALGSAGPAPAADRGQVALVPAHTFKGAAANGAVVTEAFRTALEREGFRVVAAKETEAAMKRLDIDVAKHQFVPSLTALGKELNVPCVIYPRINGVGIGLNQQDLEEFQATIHVAVIQPGKGQTLTRQIGQLFRHPERMLERAVLPRKEADEAAAKLLEPFFKKTG
jgi:hypothetical protein